MDDDLPAPAPGRKTKLKELPPGLEQARFEVLRTGGITTVDGTFYPIKPPVTEPIENPARRDYDTGEAAP